MAFLPTRTDDEQARISGNYQPGGVHLKAKNIPSKTLYKVIKALSLEYTRVEQTLNDWVDGRLINVKNNVSYVDEWESAVGIPDQSFPGVGTAEERRRQAFSKFSSEGAKAAAELKWLCSLMGFDVNVTPGYYYWLNPDARVPLASEREARFTVVFETLFASSESEVTPTLFPIVFPWKFGGNNYNSMKSFLLEIIPATVNGVFIFQAAERFGYGYFPYGKSQYGL